MGSPGSLTIQIEVLKNPILKMVAEKLDKTPDQVAFRWGLQMGHSVLPKSTNEGRTKENFDVFNWSIPENYFSIFSEIEQVSDIFIYFPCVITLSFILCALHMGKPLMDATSLSSSLEQLHVHALL